MSKEEIQSWFESLQERICTGIATADSGAAFKEDVWVRTEGGGGKTRIIENGNIIEKGCVNFSAVHGKTPDNILESFNLTGAKFLATGVSIVMHPKNPMVPIIHMNVRYFEMTNGISWFGGGIDLTPHYIDTNDAKEFHSKLKVACDKHHPDYYKTFKAQADDYFFIPHRNETRGIGGIFFDHLKEVEGISKSQRWDFVKEIGNAFFDIYKPIMRKNHSIPYGEKEKQWQYIRRGRYVEFNLVYDRGTKFGLDTNGRTESILLSLPPLAAWHYDFKPEIGSKEEATNLQLKKGLDWISTI